MNAKQVIKRYEDLKAKRVNWDDHWKQVLDYVLPEHNNVWANRVEGEKKGQTVYDNTPTQANEILASALHGMLTNPATYWFWLRTGDDSIDFDDQVRKWLQKTAIRMHEVMNQSNFQTEIHEVYQGLGAIGTWSMYIDEDPDTIVRFQAKPIYQSYIAENARGVIEEVHRCFKWDWSQIREEFKDEPSLEKIKGKYQDTQELEVIHSVYPREKFDNSGLPKNFKYASQYVLKEESLMLSEHGYREFPYVIPRWSKVSGEIYGRSPAMKCLSDIKMLNKIMKTQIKGLEKTVDPPLLIPDDGVILPMRLHPGGLNFFRSGMGEFIKPLQTDARVDFGFQALEELRKRIKQAFFIDQLQLAEGPQMTATEVTRRTEEKLRLMGPILGRLHHELLRPLIDRVFAIMLRKNVLPTPIPLLLSKKKLQIQYSSLIAQAQRTSEADNISRSIQIIAPFVQANPEVMDLFDGDKVARIIGSIYNLPENVLRDESDVEQMRADRAQAQQQQMQMQQQMAQAQQVKDAGPTLLDAMDRTSE